MSRRICLSLLVASFALGAPTASLAQTSSQAQYQGVAPETQTPIDTGGNGSTGGTTGGGNSAAGGGPGTSATGSTGSGAGGTSSGASGNGGNTGTATGSGGSPSSAVGPTPSASRATSPFSGGDILLIVLACASLVGLGIVLRRTTRREPAGV
jgi:cobalamin biosynthesis Mg chelatase CobN